ncbi:MAG: AbrB/MazE/SpoVT family DNA-binding domain-containing protein [Bryobacteraceae bacterium]|jgi:AbrB family looped-hinge helix DNA binding protein
MPTPPVEYIVSTRIGEKRQLTIPKQYRDDLGLNSGAPVAVLRIGEGLMLIPEQNRFRHLCDAIASVFEERQITPASLLETLPEARERVFARRYSTVGAKERGASRRRSKAG